MASFLRPLVALVALVAAVRGWGKDVSTAVISVENGGPWGEWGEPEFCPKGLYAVGFQLKVQPPQGFFGDDTALNAVRLLCANGAVATAGEGPRGTWSSPLSCNRGHLTAFRLRVEASRGLWDDTAANNVDMACSDGRVLEGQGGRAGTWGNWSSSCPHGGGICGLRTRLEAPQRGGDDTALNSVDMFCCP
ncbi:vitelline membrane outer layer protein 1 homolog [Cuculus canorus]|uniref:vitelline membrane outer layer protein 1 homolog n=1 Tax=Cuculus canorus TaxID=55661 RepID=UPI0023AB31D4|nr:vitelline membrane outer layer protein 1 homolog [Cuculus canorus]